MDRPSHCAIPVPELRRSSLLFVLGLGLIDLVPDTFLGVVGPFPDRLVGSVGGNSR